MTDLQQQTMQERNPNLDMDVDPSPVQQLKRKASSDLVKSSSEDRKENPAALSQQSSAPGRPLSPGAEESDLTDEDEDEMLIMSQEKPVTSTAASASGSTTTTAPVKKPRQKKPKVLTPEQIQAKAEREAAKEQKEKEKAAKQAEKDAKAAQKLNDDLAKKQKKADEDARKLARAQAVEDARAAKKAAEEAAKAEKVAKKAEEERVRAERKEEIEREKVAKKEAKEKAKAEAEREREEEEKKKIQATSKQSNMFTSFFKKVDTPPAIKKRAALTTVQQSDFERTFLPFEDKKGTVRAPVNKFLQQKKLEEEADIEAISGDDPLKGKPIDESSGSDFLKSFLSTVPHSRLPQKVAFPSPAIKAGPPSSSVRQVFLRSQEAEIAGTGDPHKILDAFKDARFFRRKHLQFREDTRPAYNGTWTQSSTVVGPRTPFGQDTALFDYSYDSGDDWEEPEEGGEDLDSLCGDSPRKPSAAKVEGGEASMWDTDDEDGDFESGSDSDSDRESFLVDSGDEAEGGGAGAKGQTSPVKASGNDDDIEVVEDGGRPVTKKKKRKDKEKLGGRKKKDVKVLVPTALGPFFEEQLGVCAWDGFDSYQIRFLNDTPAGIDPFTYVAPRPVEPEPCVVFSPEKPASAIPSRLSGTIPPPPSSNAPKGRKPASTLKASGSSPKPDRRLEDKHLPKFIGMVSKSTNPKDLLTAELRLAFKSEGVKQADLKGELALSARRIGKADGSPWAIQPEAWARAGLSIPADALPFPTEPIQSKLKVASTLPTSKPDSTPSAPMTATKASTSTKKTTEQMVDLTSSPPAAPVEEAMLIMDVDPPSVPTSTSAAVPPAQ